MHRGMSWLRSSESTSILSTHASTASGRCSALAKCSTMDCITCSPGVGVFVSSCSSGLGQRANRSGAPRLDDAPPPPHTHTQTPDAPAPLEAGWAACRAAPVAAGAPGKSRWPGRPPPGNAETRLRTGPPGGRPAGTPRWPRLPGQLPRLRPAGRPGWAGVGRLCPTQGSQLAGCGRPRGGDGGRRAPCWATPPCRSAGVHAWGGLPVTGAHA
jgi:hypothetical protein